MNSSDPVQVSIRIERLYRRLLVALDRPDQPGDLRQHERDLLAHIGDGASLTQVTRHFGLPKSTASVLVKHLERRGYLWRERDPEDERRLRITLTPMGQQSIDDHAVLDIDALTRALGQLPPKERQQLVRLLGHLADAAEQ